MSKPEVRDMERRTLDIGLEVREDGDRRVLTGIAAPFNSRSEDLGWFVEELAPGAFDEAIKRSDAAALFNHNPDNLLGRQSSGSLRLEETDNGLRYEVDLPQTPLADSVRELVKRGDLRGNSFAFTVATDEWSSLEDGRQLRRVMKVDRLYDVGPVVYPAYKATCVSTRALEHVKRRIGGLALRERELIHLLLED